MTLAAVSLSDDSDCCLLSMQCPAKSYSATRNYSDDELLLNGVQDNNALECHYSNRTIISRTYMFTLLMIHPEVLWRIVHKS